MSERTIKKLFMIISIILLAVCAAVSVYLYHRQIFTSQEALQSYVAGFGMAGALIFIAFQIIQVIFPILPGGLGCLGGVILFGPWAGLIYNYIGICIGSVAAFFIAKNFGKPVLYMFFSEKMIGKYEKWTGSRSRFTKLFAIAIFLPVAPDDFLCYLAGTTQMGWKKFTSIILAGKPFAIAAYSLGLYGGMQYILSLVH